MSWLYGTDGAGEGTRTPTTVGHQNLNLARLPIPPHPHIDIVKPLRTARSIAFKATAKGLGTWESLLRQYLSRNRTLLMLIVHARLHERRRPALRLRRYAESDIGQAG